MVIGLPVCQVVPSNLAVNAVFYLAPALAVLWIWLIHGVAISPLDWFFLGFALVVVANPLIQLVPWPSNRLRGR